MSYAIALIGILLSGVVATLVTYQLNAGKEQLLFMRKKSEELYVATEGFDRALTGYYASAFPVLKGDMSWNDLNDIVIKRGSNDHHVQMQMLIDIYFPALRAPRDDYLKQRDALNGILFEHKQAYKMGRAIPDCVKRYQSAIIEFDKKAKALKDAVIFSAQNFANENALSLRSLFPGTHRNK